MNIVLINPPQLNSLDDRLDPPLGLLYIAAVLRKKQVPVKIVDLPFVERKDWPKHIGVADFYGITTYSSSLHLAREIARIAKENNPNSKVVVGGPHPTALPQETLKPEKNFDIVVEREGELTFLELAAGYPLEKIPGITYKDKNGEIRRNVSRPLMPDLDSLPFPQRDLLDMHAYTRKVYGQKATSLITSRGCPYNCSFCCKDTFGSLVRYRSVDSVLSEVKSNIDTYGINHFLFYDDTFTLKRKRLRLLCEEFKKLNIIFRCNGNARYNTYDDYQALYDGGCREIAFGIETGSQKILNLINKGTTIKQNKDAIKNAQKAKLIVKAYLMIGNPGESRETVEETKKFINEANPDQFTLFTFVPLPGCDIWKNPDKYGIKIIDRNFEQYFNIAGQNEGGLVIETETLKPADIKELREELLDFLRSRGQRGKLQDYYKTI